MSTLDERRDVDLPGLLPWLGTAPPRASQAPGANTVVPYPVESVARANGARYRGRPWRANGGLVLPGVAYAGDGLGTRLETATGYAYTGSDDSGPTVNVDVVTFNVPHGFVCVVHEVAFRFESELGYKDVEMALVVGGGASPTALGGAIGRVVNRQLGRPYDRDGAIPVWERATAGTTIRLQGTNTSTEAPHVVEAYMAGELLPVEWLGNERT